MSPVYLSSVRGRTYVHIELSAIGQGSLELLQAFLDELQAQPYTLLGNSEKNINV